MITPFSVIDNKGISCPKGTPSRKVDIITLFERITSSTRLSPPAANVQQWKAQNFSLLLDVKHRWSARDVEETKYDNENYIIVDLDHFGDNCFNPDEAAIKVREALSRSPFCCFAARSCTTGVWGLFRAKVSASDSSWFTFKKYILSIIYPVLAGLLMDNNDHKTIEDYIDESTLSHGRIRFLASDPDAIKGPAFDKPENEFSFDSCGEQTVKDSALYKVAELMTIGTIKRRGFDHVCRGPGMGLALAGAEVARPHRISLDLGFKTEKYSGNSSVIIAAPSNTGKTYGSSLLVDALEQTMADIKVLNLRTPQAFLHRLSAIQTHKNDGELELNNDLSSILVYNDEYAAMRSDNKNSKIGVDTFDAYIRLAIDGKVRAQEAVYSMREVYSGPIPFFGAFVSLATPDAVARAIQGEDQEDGRARRSFIFSSDEIDKDEYISSAYYSEEGEDIIRAELKDIYSRLATWTKILGGMVPAITCDGCAAQIIHAYDVSNSLDGRIKQKVLRLAAANAVYENRWNITVKDIRIAIAIYKYQPLSEESIAEKQVVNNKDMRQQWIDLLVKCFERKGGIVSHRDLQKQNLMRCCKIIDRPQMKKVGLNSCHPVQLWALKLIQPVDSAVKSISEMQWKLWDEEHPISMTDEDKEKYGIETQSSQPVTKNDTFNGNNCMQKRSERCQKLSVEDRRAKYVEKEITEIAKEIERLPEGTRHSTAFNKLAKLAPDLDAVGWDREAGLTEAMSRSSLPQKEIESMIEQIANDKGSIVTSEPSKGLKNIQ